MAVQVRWSPRAAADLERICNHIGQDSETYAALFAKRVVALVEELAEFPRSGRVDPEYGIETLRERIFQNYRVVYRLRSDAVCPARSLPSSTRHDGCRTPSDL